MTDSTGLQVAALQKTPEQVATPSPTVTRAAIPDLLAQNQLLTQSILFGRAPSDDAAALIRVMAVVQCMRPAGAGTGLWTMSVDGAERSLTTEQAEQIRTTALEQLARATRRAEGDADSAEGIYQSQADVNADFPVVSRVVRGWAWLRSLGDVSDPGDDIAAATAASHLWAKASRDALARGDFAFAAGAAAASELIAQEAKRLANDWKEGLIESAGSVVTTLEYTRTAAFITLGVLAVAASGGVAAGAIAGETTAFGATVGTTAAANAIATGAPILATLGEAGMHVALGDPVDWTHVAVDVAANLLLARFSGRLGEGLFEAFAGDPAVRTLGRVAFSRLFANVATQEFSTAFLTTVDAVYAEAAGRPIIWDQFCGLLVQRMTDPTNVVTAVIFSAAQTAATPYGPMPPVAEPTEFTSEPGESEIPGDPAEAQTLLETAPKATLSPSEFLAEKAVADRMPGASIDEAPFTVERRLPNGHVIKETPDGKFCERCSGPCAVYDSDGELITEDVENFREGGEAAQLKYRTSEDIGTWGGRTQAAQDGLVEANWVNVLDDPSGHGIDDVMEDPSTGDLYLLEYKGGTGGLEGDQMQQAWVQRKVAQMRARGDTVWSQRIQDAAAAGKLKGRAYSTPIDPVTGAALPTEVLEEWTYAPF